MAINFRLSNIPPVTKATLITTFLLSLLSAAFRYRLYTSQTITSATQVTEEQLAVPFLTLIPAASYGFPWTFITAAFVQQNIISVSPLSLGNGFVWIWSDCSWLQRWWFCCMLDGILNGLGRRRNMLNFLLFVLLDLMYWPSRLACLDTISLDIKALCIPIKNF